MLATTGLRAGPDRNPLMTNSSLIVLLIGSTLLSTVVNLWFQHWNTHQVENERVRLQRGALLQEKQSELITELFEKLWMANYCLQRVGTRTGVTDADRAQYRSEAKRLFGEAARCFYPRQILFPEATALRIDALLRGLQEAQLRLSVVLEESPADETKWDRVTAEVRLTLPRIFDDLKTLTRNLLAGVS